MNKQQELTLEQFVSQETELLAQSLLGKLLRITDGKTKLSGFIVETEAYLGTRDQACHSYLGKRTPKVEAMYQEAGTIYVYTMHTHQLVNIVTGPVDDPQAVLIRAIEPFEGQEIMYRHRQQQGVALSNGPGKLTQALGITRKLNGEHLSNSCLSLDLLTSKNPKKISQSPRIGIPNKGLWTESKLRYTVAGNAYVSGIKKSQVVADSWLNH